MDAFTVSDALAHLSKAGKDYDRLIEKPDYDIGLYRPVKHDPQTPHSRDEIYVIATGTGIFRCAGETKPFAPGDMLFVARGVEHRFEDFSDATWVIFFGARASCV